MRAAPKIESPLTALVRGALADLGAGPGVLADFLQEDGDPRGILLRRRWKHWRTERANRAKLVETLAGEVWYSDSPERLDDRFRFYIRRMFWGRS